MASEQLKKKIEEYKEVNINNAQMAIGGGTKTDLFKCGKCKSNDCSYFQLQTRSADEPMTTYVWCGSCGNRWKVSGLIGCCCCCCLPSLSPIVLLEALAINNTSKQINKHTSAYILPYNIHSISCMSSIGLLRYCYSIQLKSLYL